MNFFKKLFSSKSESSPENTRLTFLLNNYSQNRSQTNYELVMKELLEGNSFLIFPSDNTGVNVNDWTKAGDDTTIKLTAVYNLDGLKVLGAFSNEKSLLNWSKKGGSPYTALKAQAALELCKELSINRIVINSDSPDMFIIERRKNMETINIEKGSKVLIGTPGKPLNGRIIANLTENFIKIENILEAYQYMQSKNNEANITIGIRLLSDTENAKSAALYAVQSALGKEPEKFFLDMVFLEKDQWYDAVTKVENSLFYKKT